MGNPKLGFDDFIGTVEPDSKPFVQELHALFMEHGCKLEVKEAKSGYMVSYKLDNKAVMNYVFRKKGMLVRIYANHIGEYMEVLEDLPDSMVKAVHAAPDCKRLTGSDECSPLCAMGCDFLLRGQRLQKCRYNAFFFLVCAENNPSIRAILTGELAERG